MHCATGVATSEVVERAHGVQIGMVTWLLALLAIELALPHHAVWKVIFISYNLTSQSLLDLHSRSPTKGATCTASAGLPQAPDFSRAALRFALLQSAGLAVGAVAGLRSVAGGCCPGSSPAYAQPCQCTILARV